MSKTLDSASAHFAASAVVSAPAPSRSEVTKEQNTSHNNINGVVQPSGDDFLKLIISCRVETMSNWLILYFQNNVFEFVIAVGVAAATVLNVTFK